ncbi:unnamed protein product [Alternaria burnsii]|nr:unnamed protein product [Alternaria burnsii]
MSRQYHARLSQHILLAELVSLLQPSTLSTFHTLLSLLALLQHPLISSFPRVFAIFAARLPVSCISIVLDLNDHVDAVEQHELCKSAG